VSTSSLYPQHEPTDPASFIDLYFTADCEQRYTTVGGRLLLEKGLPTAFFLGKTARELMPPEAARVHEAANRRALAGETLVYTWSLEGDQGEAEHYQTLLAPLRNGAGAITGMVGVGREIAAPAEHGCLFANLPGVAYRSLPDNSRTMPLVSPGYTELIGQAPSTPVRFTDVILPEDRTMVQTVIQNAVESGQPYTLEYRVRRADGRILWVCDRGAGVLDDNGELIALEGFISNVTERVEAEERLRRSRDQYLALLEQVPVLVWQSGSDGQCNYFNQTWLEFTGGPMSEQLGMGWAKGVHPEDLERCIATYTSHFEARQAFRMEYRLRHHSGEYRWIVDNGSPRFDLDGNFVGFIGVCFDITYRKQAEETLAKYQLLAKMTTSVVLFVHQETGRIMEANQAAEQVYGYSRNELITMNMNDLVVTQPATPGPAPTAGSTGRIEALHRRASGQVFPVEISSMGAEISGDPVALHLIHDITLRQRREQTRSLLHQVDEAILANQPLTQILQLTCRELVRIYQVPLAWAGTRAEDGTLCVLAAAGEGVSCLEGITFRWDPDPDPIANRPCQPHISDLTQDPRFAGSPLCAWRTGLRYSLTLPLQVNDEIIGILNLYSPDRSTFNDAALAELGHLAAQAGVSLLSARHQHLIHLQSTALSATANAVVITDRDGLIEWVNPAFTLLTGYSPEEVYGHKPNILKSGHHPAGFYRRLWETILAGDVWQGHMYNRRKDGSTYIEEMTITPVCDTAGTITHFVAIKQDITERRRQAERIEYLATHDFLTGLSNRSGLSDRLQKAVQWGQHGRQSALILLDLDNFKLVNDTVGHPAGDQLLISIARLMADVTSSMGEVARLGGDEFGILLEDVTLEVAHDVAERVRSAIDSYRFHWGDHVFALTASIGITIIDGTISADEAMALSDAALYESKHYGKNRISVRNGAGEKDENLAAARWMARIKDAIAANRFEVHYQTVNRMATGEPWHAEALVRMRDEKDQLVPPAQFIPIAERYGFMPDIDRFVIREAAKTLAQRPGMRLFINLSGITLSDQGLSDYIRSVLEQTGVNPGDLCFEVTETSALLDIANAQKRMREVKDLGCRFALDDFGSGFASFAYLRALPIDYVKLDGSFTRNLDSDVTNRALAKAVVEIAHVLGKEIIAEQVERACDASLLQEMGVEYGQGYLWSRPAAIAPRSE